MLRLVEPAPLYKAAIPDGVAEMQASGEWEYVNAVVVEGQADKKLLYWISLEAP